MPRRKISWSAASRRIFLPCLALLAAAGVLAEAGEAPEKPPRVLYLQPGATLQVPPSTTVHLLPALQELGVVPTLCLAGTESPTCARARQLAMQQPCTRADDCRAFDVWRLWLGEPQIELVPGPELQALPQAASEEGPATDSVEPDDK